MRLMMLVGSVGSVYTAMIVSKLLPMVSITTGPEAGAVQVHQTDFPPVLA